MRLRIVTPLSVAVDADDVASIRAEDASGGFGVLPGHADFITTLSPSVVSWRSGGDGWHHCAVRGGTFCVEAGDTATVTSREAVCDDDLETLETTVLERFAADAEAEKAEHVGGKRIQLAAIRQIMRHLRPEGETDRWP